MAAIAVLWLYVVGLLMSVKAIAFAEEVPPWMRALARLLWPLFFVAMLMQPTPAQEGE